MSLKYRDTADYCHAAIHHREQMFETSPPSEMRSGPKDLLKYSSVWTQQDECWLTQNQTGCENGLNLFIVQTQPQTFRRLVLFLYIHSRGERPPLSMLGTPTRRRRCSSQVMAADRSRPSSFVCFWLHFRFLFLEKVHCTVSTLSGPCYWLFYLTHL